MGVVWMQEYLSVWRFFFLDDSKTVIESSSIWETFVSAWNGEKSVTQSEKSFFLTGLK